MYDVQIYGEDNNLDCPDGQNPIRWDKYGLMLFGSNVGSKPLHPTKPSSLPIHKIKSNGAWGGQVEINNVEFHKFEATTKCGMKQHTMKRNDYASDYIPMHIFSNTRFYDVQDSAMIWIEDPP